MMLSTWDNSHKASFNTNLAYLYSLITTLQDGNHLELCTYAKQATLWNFDIY